MYRRTLLCLLSVCIQLTMGAPRSLVLSVTPGKKGPTTFIEGDTLMASCRVEDTKPGSKISWFLKDWQLEKSLSPVSITKEGWVNLIKQDLNHIVDYSDNGKTLRCVVAESEKDSKSSNEVKLNVLFSPKPPSQEYERSLPSISFPGNINIYVFANPKPNFYWTVDSERIRDGEKDKKGGMKAVSSNPGDGMWKATLEIKSVTEEHLKKNYTLTASNEWGQEMYNIKVTDKIVVIG